MAEADDESVPSGGMKREEPAVVAKEKNRKGFFSRIWNGIFGINDDDDDFEKRLQHLSKVEADFIARSKWRSQTGRRITRHLFAFFVISSVIAVAYALLVIRSLDRNWEIDPLWVLKVILVPGLGFVVYFVCDSFTKARERVDQRILERLHSEKQAKIDELKEKTNYYTTLKLIQKYDPDPATKAAAATMLASKLGADSGLKVFLQDQPTANVPKSESNDVGVVQSSGLRNRKTSLARSYSLGSNALQRSNNETPLSAGIEAPRSSEEKQLVVVDHRPPSSYIRDASWVSKLAALLVGDDPTQSYALICGNCLKHNGLARKEDYPHIIYYCPHCEALNRPKQQVEEHALDSASPGPDTNEISGNGPNGDELKRTKSSIY